MKKLIFVITLLPIVLSAFGANKKVLFIGNSYTERKELTTLVRLVAESVGDQIETGKHTVPASTFRDHDQNPVVDNLIKSKKWDYVVLQGQSRETAYPTIQLERDVFPYTKSLTDKIKANNPCGSPMFYMTWGRKDGDALNCPTLPYMCTYEGMDEAVRNTYMFMAEEYNATVSPVGMVRNYIRKNHPELNLYQADGSHPSLLGAYAAALTFYTVIFRKDPSLVTYTSSLILNDAENIRNAVKKVVYENLDDWYFDDASINFNYQSSGNNIISFTSISDKTGNYSWNFGDGNTSTQANPTHTYGQSGQYSVTLSQTTSCGNLSVTKNIEVTGDGGGSEITCEIANIVNNAELALGEDVVVEVNASGGVGGIGRVDLWLYENGQWATEPLRQLGEPYSFNLGKLPVGEYFINAYAVDTEGTFVNQLVGFSVIDITTNLQNISTNNDVTIYPNPVQDMVYVEGIAIESIQLYDIAGNLLVDKVLDRGLIDVSDLRKGLYLLKVSTANKEIITRKIIKSN